MNNKAGENRGVGPGTEAVGVSGGGISWRSLQTFNSLRNPTYRIYYLSLLGQWASMNMQMVARSLLVYRITGSGAILGLLSLASAIPMLVLSLYGGAIADRVQKKYVLLSGQASLIFVALGIAISLTLGYLSPGNPGSWWILLVSAVLQGTVMGVTMPSRQSIIPEIVREDQIMNAISLNNLGMNVFRLLAPAMAGFLIDAFDFDAIYYAVFCMYLLSTVCVIFLPRTRTMTPRKNSAMSDVMKGVKYIRHEKNVLPVLIFMICGTVLAMPFMFLIPMFTEDILNVGATGMGLIMSVSGFGAMIGSLVLASITSKRRGRLMLLSGILMGVALAIFSFSQWWYLSLFVVIFFGLGQTGHMTMGNTLVMYYSDPDYRGRVMSFMMMGIGFASLGAFFGGILAEAIGVQWAVGGMAMTSIIVSFSLLVFMPRFRKLE